jgi:hypothetical protein
MISLRRYSSLLLTSFLALSACHSQEVCSDTDLTNGVCSASSPTSQETLQQCAGTEDSAWCRSTGNLYRNSGTAQAYKANAPLKNTICNPASENVKNLKYKVASWPALRRSFRNPATVTIQVRLFSCSNTINSETNINDCCCESLSTMATNNTSEPAFIDVWQARPDGTFSSLRRKREAGDCRARVPYTFQETMIETLAPGSTGVLGGLGPAGWDFAPFAPPVIHMLASVPGHSPTLVDVPIVFHRKTLEQQSLAHKDWRGHGWMTGKLKDESAYRIVAWESDAKANHIHITMDLYLPRTEKSIPLEKALCPARVYGFPWSFFKEPIAECAPFLLDFFAL